MNPYKTHGAISWQELATSDPKAAVDFYKSVFGWEVDVMPMPTGDYNVAKVNGIGHGGVMQLPDPNMPNAWSFYVTTEDVKATIELAKELGGTIMFDPMDIPDVGTLVGIVDPTGAVIMAIQYVERPVDEEPQDYDFAMHFTTDGMFSWYELRSPNPKAADEFYSKLFGWTVTEQQMPMGAYHVCSIGETQFAGIMTPPQDEVPPHWGGYITISDLAATNEKISAAGGTIAMPLIEAEGVGSFNMFQDPTGAWISAIQYASVEAQEG